MKKIVGIVLSIILIIAILLCYFFKHDKDEFVYLDYGDSISQVKVTNSQNKQLSFPKTQKKYQIVFYLDTRCKTCIDQLEVARRLNNILDGSNIELKILWQDKLDSSLIEKHDIPANINYLSNNIKIGASTPTIYILDKNNKVIFDTIEPEKIMKKIIDLDGISLEKMKENTNKFLQTEAKKNLNYNENKSLLIYFTLDGCSDCEKSNPIVQEKKVQEKYNVLKIYNSDISEENGEMIDKGDLLLNIYAIEWYPSFLKIQPNKSEFIGETKFEDLESNILKD
jgi:hypothetical protein